ADFIRKATVEGVVRATVGNDGAKRHTGKHDRIISVLRNENAGAENIGGILTGLAVDRIGYGLSNRCGCVRPLVAAVIEPACLARDKAIVRESNIQCPIKGEPLLDLTRKGGRASDIAL